VITRCNTAVEGTVANASNLGRPSLSQLSIVQPQKMRQSNREDTQSLAASEYVTHGSCQNEVVANAKAKHELMLKSERLLRTIDSGSSRESTPKLPTRTNPSLCSRGG
jgi:hypothetical protein